MSLWSHTKHSPTVTTFLKRYVTAVEDRSGETRHKRIRIGATLRLAPDRVRSREHEDDRVPDDVDVSFRIQDGT